MDDVTKSQELVCKSYGSPYVQAHLTSKVGICKTFDAKSFPVNGLRHPLEGDATGWYIWSGAWSDDADFFVPLHTAHLVSRCPEILKYLGLAPGWRFLFAPDYEDVWKDESLLSI